MVQQSSHTTWAALLDAMRLAAGTPDRRALAEAVLQRLVSHEAITAGGIWVREQDTLVCLSQQGFTQTLSLLQIHRAIEQGAPTATSQALEIWPLTGGGTAFGALVLRGTEDSGADERAMHEALAAHLGLALHYAKPHSRARAGRPSAAESEWERFLSHAAHEIKNPLASIKGYADLLGRRAAGDTAAAPYLKGLAIISQQVSRTTFLLEQLSDLSRIGTGRLHIDQHAANLAAIVQHVAETQRAATEMHDIVAAGVETPLELPCDSVRMEQALDAMLENAIKFSPDGGTIRVELERGAREAIIAVRDRGIGVPEGEEERVFERFYRGSNVAGFYRGLGLGLFIGRAIAERHGGRMWLERAPEQGTNSFLALPLQ